MNKATTPCLWLALKEMTKPRCTSAICKSRSREKKGTKFADHDESQSLQILEINAQILVRF